MCSDSAANLLALCSREVNGFDRVSGPLQCSVRRWNWVCRLFHEKPSAFLYEEAHTVNGN